MNEKLTSWLNHWPRTEVPSPLSSLWNHIASLVFAACIPSAKPFSKPHAWSWETLGFCMRCCHQRAKPWTSSCIHEECDQAKSARFYPLGKVSLAAKMMKSCWALPASLSGRVYRADNPFPSDHRNNEGSEQSQQSQVTATQREEPGCTRKLALLDHQWRAGGPAGSCTSPPPRSVCKPPLIFPMQQKGSFMRV